MRFAQNRAFSKPPYKSLHAQPEAVQSLLDAQGPMGFYDSVANREACCNIRKVVPLRTL